MKKRIWFNQWFTTVAHFINMIRSNKDGYEFKVYGTSISKDALYLSYCDAVYQEPNINGEEYILFCLEFCRKHHIDIFVPRKENVLIAKHLNKFHQLGVKVLVCPDAKLMERLDNKEKTYRYIANHPTLRKHIHIPDYFIVENGETFIKAYHTLKAKGHKVCFKPVVGEGGKGFRIIQDKEESIDELFYQGTSANISYRQACEVLFQQSKFPPLMVSEYMDGYEYSIDCLAYDGVLMAVIPRKKENGRVRELENSKELIEVARKVNEVFSIPFAYNIQVKYKEGIPKLLEINPRMSGGLHYSCLAGINIPYQAIKLLLEEKKAIEVFQPRFGIRSSYIEKEVILNNIYCDSKLLYK